MSQSTQQDTARNATVTVVLGLVGVSVVTLLAGAIHPIFGGLVFLVGIGSVVYQAVLAVTG